jgi:hypothetical protein
VEDKQTKRLADRLLNPEDNLCSKIRVLVVQDRPTKGFDAGTLEKILGQLKDLREFRYDLRKSFS